MSFALLLAVLSTTSGVTHSLQGKAAVYFAGDLTVQNLYGDRLLDDPEAVYDLMDRTQHYQSFSARSEYLQGDATLFFAGGSVRQRRVTGIDPLREAGLADAKDYVEGAPLRADDLDGLVISRSTAERLQVRVGDEIVLLLGTATGQRATANLVVRGVLNDSSLFSYACYLHYQSLNRVLNRPQEAKTVVGGVLKGAISTQQATQRLQADLEKLGRVYPTIANRDYLQAALNAGGKGTRLAIVTLEANLAQVTEILNALSLIALATVVVFTFVVMVGVGNTYRMIVLERTKEIGTMRALGMSRYRTATLFLSEAFFLGIASSLLGCGIGLALLLALGAWDFSHLSLAQVFLVGGHIQPRVGGVEFLVAVSVLLLSSVLAVLDSASRAARLRPAEALRWE